MHGLQCAGQGAFEYGAGPRQLQGDLGGNGSWHGSVGKSAGAERCKVDDLAFLRQPGNAARTAFLFYYIMRQENILQSPCTVRRLDATYADSYRQLRLQALRDCPTAFGSSWEEESAQPLAWFAGRLESALMLGGWRGEQLCGTAGFLVHDGIKTRHKGTIVGVYVHPDARGSGMGQALIRGLVAQATGKLDTLLLTVQASNTAAQALYRKLGFEAYGREPRALKIDGRFYDEILMALRLPATAPSTIAATTPAAGQPSSRPAQG